MPAAAKGKSARGDGVVVEAMRQQYTRAELERQVEVFRLKAIEEHARFRKWQNRALVAEQRLADCGCDGQQASAPEQSALWEES